MSRRHLLALASVAAIATASGCDDTRNNPTPFFDAETISDTTPDAGDTVDGGNDTQPDTQPPDVTPDSEDATPDAQPDTVPDAEPDAVPDTIPDTEPDAVPDAIPDTEPDALPDAEPDAIPDAEPDAIPDAEPDAVPDVQPDAIPDVEPDAVPDVGPDAIPDVEPDVIPDVEPDAIPDIADDSTPDAAPDVADDTTPDVVLTGCQNQGDTCDPASDSNTEFVCLDDGLGGGQCFTICTPFTSDPTCDAIGWCQPDTQDASTGFCGELTGNEVGKGEACAPAGGTFCAADLICVGGVCETICDRNAAPAEPGACTDPELCAPLFNGQTVLDVGFCTTGCTPFTSDPTCTNGWCQPNFLDSSIGDCVDLDGTESALGGACGDDPTIDCCGDSCTDATVTSCVCAFDSFCCDTAWDGTCVQEAQDDCGLDCFQPCGADLICVGGSCQTVCAPDAANGDPGACATAGEDCGGLVSQGTPLDIGQCQETCDFHGGTDGCDAAGSVCLPGEWFGLDFDNCDALPAALGGTPLAPGDDCAAAGLEAFDTCASGATCVDTATFGNGPCTPMCATSEGAFGTTDHPDCPSGWTCTDVFDDPTIGLCVQ